ncbi:MAG: bacteriohemerythrin [Magnetospiraceae bacterium]
MEKLQWDQKLELGNEEIDLQHHYFVDLINRIIKLAEEGCDKFTLSRTLEELFRYARFHFYSEENIYRTLQVPGHILQTHQHLHERLLEVLKNKMQAVYSHGYDTHELLEFAIHWFLHHSQVDDKFVLDNCALRPDGTPRETEGD